MHGRYVTDVLKICMKKFNGEKYFLTKKTSFDLHIAGVYCKPCLQPIFRSILVDIQIYLPSNIISTSALWPRAISCFGVL